LMGFVDRATLVRDLAIEWLFVGVCALLALAVWRAGVRRYAAFGGGSMRDLRLLGGQLYLSLVLALQYRWGLVMGGGLSAIWTAMGLVPLYAAFQARPVIGGWSYDRALLVVGWFTVLKAVLDGAINPSLVAVVERIRQGTLDFTLIKPVDAQFLVSTAKF